MQTTETSEDQLRIGSQVATMPIDLMTRKWGVWGKFAERDIHAAMMMVMNMKTRKCGVLRTNSVARAFWSRSA
eukprot:3933313-Pleurochrysis_carterae.AAC.2